MARKIGLVNADSLPAHGAFIAANICQTLNHEKWGAMGQNIAQLIDIEFAGQGLVFIHEKHFYPSWPI